MRALGGRAAAVGPVEEGEGRRLCRASPHAAFPSPCRGDDRAGRDPAASDAPERDCRSLATQGIPEDECSSTTAAARRRRRRLSRSRRRIKVVVNASGLGGAKGGHRRRHPLPPTRDLADGPGTAGTHGYEPPSEAGADWLTAPCRRGGVDGSTQCVLGAAEPRLLAPMRRGRGDAHAGRPGIRTGSPRIVRGRLRRAVIIVPMHGEPMFGRRHPHQPTLFFVFHATSLFYSARHRAQAARPAGGFPPVARFTMRIRRNGIREARFPSGGEGNRGPQRPRRGGAPPLAGGDGGGHDGLSRLCGEDAAVSDGGDEVLRNWRCTRRRSAGVRRRRVVCPLSALRRSADGCERRWLVCSVGRWGSSGAGSGACPLELVVSCTGGSYPLRRNLGPGQLVAFVPAQRFPPLRTKSDDGGRYRRRRKVNRTCLSWRFGRPDFLDLESHSG